VKRRFHPAALDEIEQASQYYAGLEPGLGLDFLAEAHSALRRAADHPLAWPSVGHGIRRCQLRRFPYGLLYAIEGDVLYVLAVMHMHRRPEHWLDRLTE